MDSEPVEEFDAFPDLRLVTVSIDATEGEVGDVEIDATGVGHYEALGMLLSAIVKLCQPLDPDEELDDDDD